MNRGLSPAKVLLLAAHMAATSDIGKLAILAFQNAYILRQEILLRILLTYLPETVEPSAYTQFLHDISDGQLRTPADFKIDTSPVDILNDETATKRAKKLCLLPLGTESASKYPHSDLLSSFLFQRTYRVNSELGVVSQLPDLLEPFLEHDPAIKHWVASTVLPFVRRNCENNKCNGSEYTLSDFENLPDRTAAIYLLSESSDRDGETIGRHLRQFVTPWLYSDVRWQENSESEKTMGVRCTAWEQVQEIILGWATQSWTSAAGAINHWNGPRDAYFGDNLMMGLSEDKMQYLESSYARMAIACVYSISDQSMEALRNSYLMCCAVHRQLGYLDSLPTVDSIFLDISLLPNVAISHSVDSKLAAFMRHDLLKATNKLTSATPESLILITALTISALLSTSLGVSCSVRNAGDLLFLGDTREQKAELSRLLRAIADRAPRDDDTYWTRSRKILLWLFSWRHFTEVEKPSTYGRGPLGMIPREYIETEILKAMLSKSRYSLSRAIYEDGVERPLSGDNLQEAVYQSALHAYDNASNPNRNRGGLKKCDEIIHSFPKTLESSSLPVQKVEALLRASHALSEYRLVLKQGEPFSPIVLRVHSDPIAILEKVLSQNPEAYTRLQEFLEIGASIVKGGLTSPSSSATTTPVHSKTEHQLFVAEKRIIAMCIEAALNEDDFETAYSYVISRLGYAPGNYGDHDCKLLDHWSWEAALRAGQYIRTERSQQPTHLGTASSNLQIRHLEQRIECLATALRAAPSAELQFILKSFRRCEEQLDSAVREEAANEAAWDTAGDLKALPGNFETKASRPGQPPRNMSACAAAKQGDEAPMSLFDLSRATARIAQRNLTLPSFHSMPAVGGQATQDQQGPRTRKRDQLRDAATGTIVSGVGWLLGANVSNGAGPGNEIGP